MCVHRMVCYFFLAGTFGDTNVERKRTSCVQSLKCRFYVLVTKGHYTIYMVKILLIVHTHAIHR